jgi:hypothetical protein
MMQLKLCVVPNKGQPEILPTVTMQHAAAEHAAAAACCLLSLDIWIRLLSIGSIHFLAVGYGPTISAPLDAKLMADGVLIHE